MSEESKSLEETGLLFSNKILQKTEWLELQRHKRSLVEVLPVIESLDGYEEHYNRLEGLLNFLDAVQDFVADHTQVPEEVVFDR